ncbi:MAG: DUF4097 family beta strand repeat-containing protein [Bacillota bacterium]|nr:DUF4097 family beta strand repeat-containing protein [Bacillota bacterium]
MSINEERMLILKMLEEGKITSEEAAKLIEALENDDKQDTEEKASAKQKQEDFHESTARFREKMHNWKNDREYDWKNDTKKSGQKDFDRMVDEFSSKAERLGKNVAATTVGIVDKVIDFVGSFVDTNSFNIFGSYAAVDKTYEAQVSEGADLLIEGVNGHILVKKHLEDKIVIKSRIRCPGTDTYNNLLFSEDGNNVSMKVAKNIGNISVSHEVFLPAVRFKNLKFETSNGKIYVEDALAENFESITKNSHIDLMGVNSDRVWVDTKNGRIQISYLIGKDVEVNTSNSLIDIKNMKAENLKAVTTNGRISVENAQNYEGLAETNLYLKTKNGGIKVNMNDMDNKGYKVRAKTTNGKINLLIPDIIYQNISKQYAGSNFLEAESREYEGYPEKVYINAETVNGYIEIVK